MSEMKTTTTYRVGYLCEEDPEDFEDCEGTRAIEATSAREAVDTVMQELEVEPYCGRCEYSLAGEDGCPDHSLETFSTYFLLVKPQEPAGRLIRFSATAHYVDDDPNPGYEVLITRDVTPRSGLAAQVLADARSAEVQKAMLDTQKRSTEAYNRFCAETQQLQHTDEAFLNYYDEKAVARDTVSAILNDNPHLGWEGFMGVMASFWRDYFRQEHAGPKP